MNYQPAFAYPLEELKSGFLYLDTNMRGCWEARSVDLGWMRAEEDGRYKSLGDIFNTRRKEIIKAYLIK
jgi:hypothetical protein